MKKTNKYLIMIFIVCFVFSGCGNRAVPDKHELNDINTVYADDEGGADVYNGSLDNANSKYYIFNDFYNSKSEDTLHIIPQFETYQQTTYYTCGCAALYMVLHEYGIDKYSEMDLADMADADMHKGTSVEGLCQALDTIGLSYDYYAGTEGVFADAKEAEYFIISNIDKGYPIMVDWEDWSGHWMTVIGIDTCDNDDPDDDVIIMADPFDITDHFQDGYYTFPFGRFFEMWREGPCAEKENPYIQSYVVAYPNQ